MASHAAAAEAGLEPVAELGCSSVTGTSTRGPGPGRLAGPSRSVPRMVGAPSPRSPALPRSLVGLFATACGLSVANLYYAQPLLHTVARAFHCGSGTAGLVVTASQIGYAAGLALLVPVGDIVDRRKLTPAVLVLTAVALLASAVAPSIGVLVAVAVVVGIGSVAAQILVPFAASLADDAHRGRVVGTVMSGLLLGILLARTLSGIVAQLTSWRVVYYAGAGLMVALAAVLLLRLPAEEPRAALPYPRLLASSARLFASEPLLRRRGLLGALGFAAFSVFWTTAAFLLAGPPFHYDELVIGLFGLVGAAGALCASAAGRLADRGRARPATAAFALAVAGSFALLWWGRASLTPLIVGIVLLDIGVQGLQVTNQSLIYRLAPETRSRVTSVYMVMYFVGGAVGSAVAGAVYDSGGWAGVCVLGAAIGVAAMIVWAVDALSPVDVPASPDGGGAPAEVGGSGVEELEGAG
jgi:predicted MFS family arabinose efflux permease